jgi:hypothetical protein
VHCSEAMRRPSRVVNVLFWQPKEEYKNMIIMTSQIATIMGTLVQLKRQIVVLEVDCSMLYTMVINLSKGEHSGAI